MPTTPRSQFPSAPRKPLPFLLFSLVKTHYRKPFKRSCLLSCALSSTKTQVAINCGSPLDVLAGTGVIYQLDTYFTGGTALVTQPYQVFLPFLSLWDDFIYISARTGASVYNVPIPNGYYIVELRFAEIEDKKLGERVFSVKVQVRRGQG
jgi:hypothetical protein